MAAPVCAYTRASRGVFMWMGLQGWYQALLMQSQEGQGTLDECEASQRWGEFTRIKTGCEFSKEAQTGNLLTLKWLFRWLKWLVCMLANLRGKVVKGTMHMTTSICPGTFICPDAEISHLLVWLIQKYLVLCFPVLHLTYPSINTDLCRSPI